MSTEENIEKSVFEEIPTEKIYSEKAIRIATFLAGPLVAGYCIAENFRVFNDKEKAQKTWIITGIASFFIICLVFLLPENFPSIIFPIVYSFIASYFLKTYQEKNIQNHMSNGGETYSGWRMTLIGLISLLTFLAIIMSLLFIVGDNF
ncbi:hypothetical protein [Flavobacterium phragmitis]|uniref:Uncharacterized protein n=1 Tax=Flavobacterium phragmitis TaxID=739143 RepID=A0A1I1N514_9FLAO|nr:hypothetical protein [Flavobacterium phragmitis]SFC92515.1 hypothetical protein SAMN05216297_10374 [Flavobacterium phragmitis]